MSDVSALDTALLELQEELTKFKNLQPKLDDVRKEAEELIAQCKSCVAAAEKESRSKIQTAVKEVSEEYGSLSQRNREQFDKLEESWSREIALAEKAVSSTEKMLNQSKAVSVEISSLATRVHSLATSIAEVNFPLRLDKIDVSVASVVSTVQSLQSCIDRSEEALVNRLRTLELSVERKVETTGESVRSMVKSRTEVIEDDIKQFRDKHDEQIADIQKFQKDALKSRGEAERQLQESISWYGKRALALGILLIVCVLTTFAVLARK
jgi:hypothetical protein